MKVIKVNLGKRSYNIVIGTGIIGGLGRYIRSLNIGGAAYVITNAAIKKKYGRKLETTLRHYGFLVRFKVVPDTEKSKSLETACSVIKDIAAYDKKKQTFIIAFGGGVIGDLAGFIASIYKRGIAYIQVPTTLLAQVDSSIGGKTAVDLSVGKNLVGAFYQPRLVFADTAFLKTLEARQIKAGLAEVVKYGIISDVRLFEYLENNYKEIISLKVKPIEFIVERCASIKAGIISRDEREKKGVRTILNFGHTIGHAIEAASGFKGYNHGEAVALGMLVASDISSELQLINDKTSQRIEELVKVLGLPVGINKISFTRIINAHYRDKKFIGSKNRFVLINGIGRATVAANIDIRVIRKCLDKRML